MDYPDVIVISLQVIDLPDWFAEGAGQVLFLL